MLQMSSKFPCQTFTKIETLHKMYVYYKIATNCTPPELLTAYQQHFSSLAMSLYMIETYGITVVLNIMYIYIKIYLDKHAHNLCINYNT